MREIGGGVEGQDQVRNAGMVLGAAHAFGFDRIGGVAQACGVGKVERDARDDQAGGDGVAGGARRGGDDGEVGPGDGVEQRGFAGIGRADNHHREAIAQAFGGVGGAQRGGEFVAQGLDGGRERTIGGGGKILVGEVDDRGELGHGVDQSGAPALDRAAGGAVGLFEGHAALGFGFGVDQVGDAFGLEQVDFAVGEGAAGEFAGFGGAGAEGDQRVGDGGAHGTSAMEMEFGIGLAGNAGGRRKPEEQAPINRRAGGGSDGAQAGHAGWRQRACEPGQQRFERGAGQADDGDRAADAGGGGENQVGHSGEGSGSNRSVTMVPPSRSVVRMRSMAALSGARYQVPRG